MLFEVSFHGVLGANLIRDADGVRFAKFVVDEEFANEPYLQPRTGHAPDLAGLQGRLRSESRFGLIMMEFAIEDGI